MMNPPSFVNLYRKERPMEAMTATDVSEERTPFGTDKVTHYNWKSPDHAGRLQYINKNVLLINADYQRTTIKPKVLELAKNWSWLACGAITVGHRDGGYWIVDGQHRVMAARKRSDIHELPCLVYELSEVSEEAQGFLDANANRKPVNAVAKHRAAVVANDPLSLRLQALFDGLGIVVSDNQSNSPRHMRCIALAKSRAKEDFAVFERVLRVASVLADEADMHIHERLVDGLWYVARNVVDGFDQPRLQKRVREIGARNLLDGAGRAAAYFVRGGARVFGVGMMEALNKGLQKRFSLRDA